jgi:hypothetical protein
LTLERAAPPPAPVAPWLALATRTSTTVAWAGELAAEPALLERYGGLVGGTDDATLVVLLDGDDDMPRLVELVEGAGLSGDHAADLLAHPAPATAPAGRYLASRADAVLSKRPGAPFDRLPRHAAART